MKCQKNFNTKKKYLLLFFGWLLLCIYGVFYRTCDNASALELGDPQTVYVYPTNPTKAQVRYGQTEQNFYPTEMVAGYNTFQFDVDIQSPGFVYNTQYQLYDLSDTISAGNYLIPITIQYQQKNLSSGLEYRAPGSNGSILLTTCVNTATQTYINSSTAAADITCTYLIYLHNYKNNNELTLNIQPMISFQTPGMNIRFSKNIGIIPVTTSASGGGSSADIADIKNRVAALLAETYVSTDVQRAILNAIQNQSGSLETALENAMESHDEQQKQEYEDQQDEVNDEASDAEDEAETATASITAQMSNIVNAIIEQPATNCNIRIQRGAFDTGELNMCNVPGTIKTTILMIITIPVTLGVLRSMYALFNLYVDKVRKEQD